MKRKVDNSTEDDAPRVPLIERVRPFVLIFLLLFKYDYEEKLPEIIKDNERIEAELLANNQ